MAFPYVLTPAQLSAAAAAARARQAAATTKTDPFDPQYEG